MQVEGCEYNIVLFFLPFIYTLICHLWIGLSIVEVYNTSVESTGFWYLGY